MIGNWDNKDGASAVAANTSQVRDSNLDPALFDADTSDQTMSASASAQPQPAYQRRSPYDRPRGGASPPPHTSSPTPSIDRSNVSTPPVPGAPPQQAGRHSPAGPPPQQHHQYAPYDMSRGYPGGYMYAPPPPPPAQYHPHPDERGHGHPYGDHYAPQPYPIAHGGYVPYPLPGTVMSAPPMGPSGGVGLGGPGGRYGTWGRRGGSMPIAVVHTDDAATKLSDRVRRRCFNCCTTDTSTWRRSNLSPGKVLCNKCGLFERTHSRPRPEQFPHKRGPLASSTLRSRSPHQAQAQTYQNPAHYPPPPGPGPSYAPPPPASSAPPNGAPLSAPTNGVPAANGGPQNGSHPGTPNPQQQNEKLPGVDAIGRPPSRDERREREEERREEGAGAGAGGRRERSPE
ncbi:GATA type zinc finger protein asd-4 [Mycena venus]|uniref:GATA type zinc finger protein asd-4 n=1 Tax=Mycena venus TaxID=2733690 RepID=A0A8H7CXG0_9AGAR|nr:GATA type zinc finger protein asd-4 [Mycena venus]